MVFSAREFTNRQIGAYLGRSVIYILYGADESQYGAAKGLEPFLSKPVEGFEPSA